MSIKQRKYTNQFSDAFKYLTSAAFTIKDLAIKTNMALTRTLPSRILSKANIFNTTIDVVQDLSSMVLLHVEDSLIENNINIAQKEISIRGLATLAGHNAVRAISAKGSVKVTFNYVARTATPIMVFNNTEFTCESNGMKYVLDTDFVSVSTASSTTILNLIEGSYEKERIIAEGVKNEKIELDSVYPIENSHIKVYVNNELWKEYDSFYDMGLVTKSYIIKNGIGNQVDICFGNGRHGRALQEGDIVDIHYLTSSGEAGNILIDNPKFTISGGVFDVSGNELAVNEMLQIELASGFNLGSNGEHIEVTRNIAGYNSRAMVFTKPENVQAYLSRLSILSHIDAWAEDESNVFHLVLAPNISKKLISYATYLSFSASDLVLSNDQRNSVLEYINESGRQSTSTEIVLHDPKFSKYAIFCYIDGNIVDKSTIKQKIENTLAKVFLDNTFLDVDLSSNDIITKSELQQAILDETDLSAVNLNIFSEENEAARINGGFNLLSKSSKLVNDKRLLIPETFTTSSANIKTSELSTKIKLRHDQNPQLGFDDFGSIKVSTRENLPILSGNFLKYDSDGDHFLIEKPIYIFRKTEAGFEEL